MLTVYAHQLGNKISLFVKFILSPYIQILAPCFLLAWLEAGAAVQLVSCTQLCAPAALQGSAKMRNGLCRKVDPKGLRCSPHQFIVHEAQTSRRMHVLASCRQASISYLLIFCHKAFAQRPASRQRVTCSIGSQILPQFTFCGRKSR